MQHVSCNWEILINFGLSYEKHCYFLWFWVGLLMSFKFPMVSPWLSRAWVVSIGLCRRRGNLFGFFDGTTWALCCARVCQLHPKAVPCMEFHFARYGCSYVRWIVILLSIFWKGLLCYHFEQRIIPWGAFIVCHPNKMIFLKFNAKYDDSFVGWQARFFLTGHVCTWNPSSGNSVRQRILVNPCFSPLLLNHSLPFNNSTSFLIILSLLFK